MYEKKFTRENRVKNRPERQKADFFKEKKTILSQHFGKSLLNRPRSAKSDHITNTIALSQ